MGGRASRQKGMRGEYLVRDYFRDRGWTANRVPSSGAAEGFKGDIELTKEGKTLTAEVKFRKDAFTTIYALLDSYKGLLKASIANVYVISSYEFRDLGFSEATNIQLFEGLDSKTPGAKKLKGLLGLVKTCDFLVIKQNNKPLIFIRFWGPHVQDQLSVS